MNVLALYFHVLSKLDLFVSDPHSKGPQLHGELHRRSANRSSFEVLIQSHGPLSNQYMSPSWSKLMSATQVSIFRFLYLREGTLTEWKRLQLQPNVWIKREIGAQRIPAGPCSGRRRRVL